VGFVGYYPTKEAALAARSKALARLESKQEPETVEVPVNFAAIFMHCLT
jgi:hypothetical protein